MKTVKTIGYVDRCARHRIYKYMPPGMTKTDRITGALKELQHVGNIEIYLIKGNKQRLIATHYM